MAEELKLTQLIFPISVTLAGTMFALFPVAFSGYNYARERVRTEEKRAFLTLIWGLILLIIIGSVNSLLLFMEVQRSIPASNFNVFLFYIQIIGPLVSLGISGILLVIKT